MTHADTPTSTVGHSARPAPIDGQRPASATLFMTTNKMAFPTSDSLDIETLSMAYRTGDLSAAQVLEGVLKRIEAYDDKSVWIHRVPPAQVMDQLRRAEERLSRGEALPLFGIPFAVKDNIDVAGIPTTAACPSFSYVPKTSATVVDKLWAAGAILMGKTNLDQFATGLTGSRSPYGTCRNPFDPAYIAGGSSSGSAVAVSAGLVSFSLGTDTAGSGRVPAAFCNLVGLKPTRGLLSTMGLIPACRSLDCISIMSLTCADARLVCSITEGFDPQDSYSRRSDEIPRSRPISLSHLRIGIPSDADLKFFGNTEAEALYRQAVDRLRQLGGMPVTIDYKPFARAASLLYDGPWLSERLAAVKDLMADCPEAFLPVIRTILQGARRFDAIAAFEGIHDLRALVQQAANEWEKMDMLLLPTTPTVYRISEVEADPIGLNKTLGYYTNFVNLMDLSALALPAGFTSDGLALGITLVAGPGQESALLRIGDRYHQSLGGPMGATQVMLPPASSVASDKGAGHGPAATVKVVVVGAHLSGQPLNHQLTERDASLSRTCRTAPCYRLYALPGTVPPKPGLVRSANSNGVAIEVEVWEMTVEAFGSFVAAIPPPLGVGTILLEDGESIKGFLCEDYVTTGARDISSYGGWRNFLAGA